MDVRSPVGSQHHIVPVRTYAITLLALLVLMGLTIYAAQLPLGQTVNNLISMGIAVTKAALVFFIFMGVKWSTKLTKLWAILGFVWLSLIFGILLDYATRTHEVVPGFYNDSGSALKSGDASDTPQQPVQVKE